MKRLLVFSFCLLSFALLNAQRPGDIVILYENDVHCAVDGYPVLAGLRDSMQRMGCHVAVVSAGDFSFGGPIGAASKGEFVIRLMNAVGYDAACLGNHEFDFGFAQLRKLEGMLNAPLLCANFYPNEQTESDNRYFRNYQPTPFNPFVMRNMGGLQVAFVGVTTPTTMYTSNPSSFKDEEGNFIYNFSPNNLAATVQRNIDAARAAALPFGRQRRGANLGECAFATAWGGCCARWARPSYHPLPYGGRQGWPPSPHHIHRHPVPTGGLYDCLQPA